MYSENDPANGRVVSAHHLTVTAASLCRLSGPWDLQAKHSLLACLHSSIASKQATKIRTPQAADQVAALRDQLRECSPS